MNPSQPSMQHGDSSLRILGMRCVMPSYNFLICRNVEPGISHVWIQSHIFWREEKESQHQGRGLLWDRLGPFFTLPSSTVLAGIIPDLRSYLCPGPLLLSRNSLAAPQPGHCAPAQRKGRIRKKDCIQRKKNLNPKFFIS